MIHGGCYILNQCCGVWFPFLQGVHKGVMRHFLLTVCCPITFDNEDLALAVHISISILASLHLVACSGSLWCDTLVSFEPIP